LAQFAPQETNGDTPTKGRKSKKGKKSQNLHSEINLSKYLFDTYNNTEDHITRCAISFLLKTGCKINDKEGKPEKFGQRRRKLEIQIQRLTEKLAARIPKGRDLTDTQ
jgi:predicted transcriptional regulator